MVRVALLDKVQKKTYTGRLLSNFNTTVGYMVRNTCYVLYLHSTECFTGKRGLDRNDMLYE